MEKTKDLLENINEMIKSSAPRDPAERKILFEVNSGYINITKLASQYTDKVKTVHHWKQLEKTKDLLKNFSKSLNISAGGNSPEQKILFEVNSGYINLTCLTKLASQYTDKGKTVKEVKYLKK